MRDYIGQEGAGSTTVLLTTTTAHWSGRLDRVAVAALVSAGTIIGISTVLAGVAQDRGLSSLAYLTWSTFGATVLLVARGAALDRLPRLDHGTVRYFVIAGVVSLAAPNLLLFSAVPKYSSSLPSRSTSKQYQGSELSASCSVPVKALSSTFQPYFQLPAM